MLFSTNVFPSEFGEDLRKKVNQAVTGKRSTAIIIFSDEFTDKNGKKLDWIAGWQPWGPERKVTLNVDGEKYRQGFLGDFKCALPYICIIRDFPTKRSYRIAGDLDNAATKPRRFSRGQECLYNSSCLLKNNGEVHAKLWIRPEREGGCISPKDDEEYYDILVACFGFSYG